MPSAMPPPGKSNSLYSVGLPPSLGVNVIVSVPAPGTTKSVAPILVAERVAADDDGLGPPRHQARDVLADDRLAKDRAADDVADRPVRRPVHLLQAELLDARLVGGDRRALDGDPVLLGGVRRVDRDLIVGLVAALDPEVEVLDVDVEVRKQQLVFDEVPDDARHLVAVHLDDRVLHLDLRLGHGRELYHLATLNMGDRYTLCAARCFAPDGASERPRAPRSAPGSSRGWLVPGYPCASGIRIRDL